MGTGILESNGLCAQAGSIIGQVSPAHPVAQDPRVREAFSVPPGAQHFVFSYPVEKWRQVESDAYALDDWGQCACAGSAAMKSFLAVGGYLYLDASNRVISATTLAPWASYGPGGLHFSEPRRWKPAWTEVLVEHGRLQQVTIRALVELGAWLFCWLQPGEVLVSRDGPLQEQPHVPHGGFVYLFHKDPMSTEDRGVSLDRYFPVTPPLELPYDKLTDKMPACEIRLFSLVDADRRDEDASWGGGCNDHADGRKPPAAVEEFFSRRPAEGNTTADAVRASNGQCRSPIVAISF